jgi:hypothetical protein
MINPDSVMTRFESQTKFSATNIHHGSPGVHESYHESGMGGADKNTKSSLLNIPNTKT